MMEQLLEPENLSRAWHRVKTNAGAPGIDGMSIEAFPDFNREHWPRICSALMNGTYRPAPVRRVFIPKPDGSQRPLGVPTVLDRVIQQALVTGPTNRCMNKEFLTCAKDGLSVTTGKTPVSDRNRRMPTGTCGGVALVAG
jgi:hypothetical protein